jgi:hypothetical protein
MIHFFHQTTYVPLTIFLLFFFLILLVSALFCDLYWCYYFQARLRASDIGSIVDELTELTTSKMAQIQEQVVEAKMDLLNTAVDKAQRKLPSSYKKLYTDIRNTRR